MKEKEPAYEKDRLEHLSAGTSDVWGNGFSNLRRVANEAIAINSFSSAEYNPRRLLSCSDRFPSGTANELPNNAEAKSWS